LAPSSVLAVWWILTFKRDFVELCVRRMNWDVNIADSKLFFVVESVVARTWSRIIGSVSVYTFLIVFNWTVFIFLGVLVKKSLRFQIFKCWFKRYSFRKCLVILDSVCVKFTIRWLFLAKSSCCFDIVVKWLCVRGTIDRSRFTLFECFVFVTDEVTYFFALHIVFLI